MNNTQTDLADFDKHLLSYFTDAERPRDIFRNHIAAHTLSKRIFIIHGVGGVGKSSLLRIFRLYGKNANAVVALTSGDEAKSTLDVLVHWVEDLKVGGVALPSFGKTYKHYRRIQAKAKAQAQKSASGRATHIVGEAVSKTAEVALSTLASAAIGSIIPGIGTVIGGVGGALGGMGTEALVDWLRGFLKQTDIDLLLDPTKKLTENFLVDVARAANKRRIILMLDAFEQMTVFDNWVCDIAQQLPANTLFVIAGRALPNWSRTWQSWMTTAQIVELQPMTEDLMRDLVRRYYATMRGDAPNPVQVEAIIRFARGLPIVVTSAVQLWVKYGVEDFHAVKPEIVANLVDRLMEGVSSTLIPVLEAAAIVHWFDQPILRAVTELADVRDVHNELRRFPFVRPRSEGLALHDAVREIMNENLHVQDPERYCELHERAAAYFEKQLEKTTGEEAERIGLERLYHRVCADEEAGIQLFQEMAEELVRYRFINRLRTLLNDANTYPLECENSKLWRQYYEARLAHLEVRLIDAKDIYQTVGNNEIAEPKLRAYALCDLGAIGEGMEMRSSIESYKSAIPTIEQSIKLSQQLDSKLIFNLLSLSEIYRRTARWPEAEELLKQVQQFFETRNDVYGVAQTWQMFKDLYVHRGEWHNAFHAQSAGLEALSKIASRSMLKASLLGRWALGWIDAGRYSEAERNLEEALALANSFGITNIPQYMWDLGLALGMQAKYEQAEYHFTEAIRTIRNNHELDDQMVDSLVSKVYGFMGTSALKEGKFEIAQKYLISAFEIKEKLQDSFEAVMILLRLGELQELRSALSEAESYYKQALDLRWTERHYFICAALTGLVRVKYTQNDYAAIPSLLEEAEQLAQQYEYNDHLASLRLMQGMMTDNIGHLHRIQGNEKTTTLEFFKQAMIYALRYNRFLLDEVLSGRLRGTPLHPVIPYCLAHAEEGQQMLIALRDWWKTDINDIGTPNPHTNSPIPEGVPLLEAECAARQREPGDGSQQKNVLEQIGTVLSIS